MNELDDRSVDLILTSPPYWQLKDYGTDDQIGYNDTYENYINNLNLVWKECFRVLQDGCRLCINIGDQFARSVYYGRYKVIPIRTEIIKFCETIGFDYMGAIIWQKATTMNTTGGGSVMGSFPYPRNGILKIDYEFILLFKKQGIAPRPSREIKEQSKMTKEEWNQYFQGHWNFNGARQDGHIAMFPEELPKRLIKMFSFVGDTVLDPFLGSGTTSLAAKNLFRNSVGYEINRKFIGTVKKKLGVEKEGLFHDAEAVFLDQENSETDFSERMSQLPYVFRDPLAFDKKVDPKKLHFGSVIDGKRKQREEFFTVREVIGSNVLKLNNGMIISLLGVRENPGRRAEAQTFLARKTKGQKVFLSFDEDKYDEKNNLLGYLYLRNKTFINAHLIKNGYALADRERKYRYREKFIRLSQTYAA